MLPISKGAVGSTGTNCTLPNSQASKVGTVVIMGIPSFLAVAWAPMMWSECSWVTRSALIIEGSTPAVSIRDISLLQLSPASTIIASPSHSMTAQFPSLPLARMCASSIFGPFSCTARR